MTPLSYGKSALTLLTLALAFLVAGLASAGAATKAIILVGLAGEQAVWEDFEAERAGWQEALAANGVSGEAVQVIVSPQGNDANAPREQFRKAATEAFAAWKTTLTAQDDAVLVLIGHGSTRGERYTFQNRGERLALKDFQVLTELPARSLTAIITGPGGLALSNLLRGPNRVVVSATMVETEINHTKFGTFLATQLVAKPDRPLIEAFRAAAQHTEAYYTAAYRVPTEHSILYLGADDGIEPPFELPAGDPRIEALPRWTLASPGLGTPPPAPKVAALDTAPTSSTPPPEPETKADAETGKPAAKEKEAPTELGTATRDLGDLAKLPQEFRLIKEDAVIDQVPYVNFRDATPEEMALFKDVPPPTEYPEAGGIMLLNEMRVDVKDTLAWTRTLHTRLYMRDLRIRDLVDRLYSPPMNGLGTIKHLKTISPAGKVVEVQPDALANFARTASGAVMLFAPGVEPGVIVDCEISEQGPAPSFDAFYEEHALQLPVPTLKQEIALVTAKPDSLRWKIYGPHAGQRTEEKLPYSHRQTWTWEKLPARPPREPGTPSDFDTDPRLVLTSYKSWEDFLNWYQALMKSVHESSDLIKAKATELAAGKTDETAKIKACYDYVNNLRYIAISGGANGWRPRNPTTTLARQFGDCKDKANLLIALLGELDIKAHFVLVARGHNVDPEVPTYAFNHAIAVLPGKTPEEPWTWMDATDTSTPFGMVPPGDADRWGFVITGPEPKDYVLKKITAYQNKFVAESRMEITLTSYDAATGKAEAELLYQPAGVEMYAWAQKMRAAEPVQVRQMLAAEFLDVWPESETKDVVLAAGPGTEKATEDPRFQVKMAFELGKPDRLELPRPFWRPDRDLAMAAFGRQTDYEMNDGYPQKFIQTLTVPKSVAPPIELTQNLPPPGIPQVTATVAMREAGESRVIESMLHITEAKLPAAQIAAVRDLLKVWVKNTSEPQMNVAQ